MVVGRHGSLRRNGKNVDILFSLVNLQLVALDGRPKVRVSAQIGNGNAMLRLVGETASEDVLTALGQGLKVPATVSASQSGILIFEDAFSKQENGKKYAQRPDLRLSHKDIFASESFRSGIEPGATEFSQWESRIAIGR